MGLNAPSFARDKSAGCPLEEIFSHRFIEVWISCFNSVMLSGRPSWIYRFIQSLMKKFSGLRSGEHCGQIKSDILTSVFLVSDLPAIHDISMMLKCLIQFGSSVFQTLIHWTSSYGTEWNEKSTKADPTASLNSVWKQLIQTSMSLWLKISCSGQAADLCLAKDGAF